MSTTCERTVRRWMHGQWLVMAALWLGATAAHAATAYVPSNNAVSVVDTGTGSLITSIPLSDKSAEMALTPDGKFIYVAMPESTTGAVGNTVAVVATETNSVVANIAVGDGPRGLAITPNGKFVYVGNSLWSSVWVIATDTNTVAATIAVGTSPYSVAIAPDGAFAYVANINSSSVSVIDTATNTVVKTISVGQGPISVTVSPDGAFAYVSSYVASTISVIDTASKTVTKTFAGNSATAAAVTPDGHFLYVAVGTYATGFSISMLDATTGALVTSIPETSPIPHAELAMSPDGSAVYISGAGGQVVSVLNTSTNTISSTIPIASSGAVVFAPASNAPAILTSVSVKPASVTGGTTATGSVALSALAPSGGAVVSLTSSNAAAKVPSSIRVPAGSKTFSFAITTSVVADQVSADISATYQGASKTAHLSIAPAGEAVLSSVSVNPTSVMAGTPATGTVRLSAPAPAGGVAVALWTNGSPAFVPSSVTVRAGSSSATFPVTTIDVSAKSQGTITAFYNGSSKTATLTVTPNQPLALASIQVSPTTVVGGNLAVGTIHLNVAAPAGGVKVYLWTDGSAAFVPASVTVAAGSVSATFPVTTISVSGNVQSTITAFYNGSTKNVSLTVTCAPVNLLSSVTVSPGTIAGGKTVIGTVTLSEAAPAGNTIVYLWTNGSPAFVPASVTIIAGKRTANFTVTTNYVSTNTRGTITAFQNGVSKTTTLTVTP